MPTELASLLDSLNQQRRHVLGILEGLDDEAFRRPVLPSGWDCSWMVGHLAHDDERFWFAGVVAGDKDVLLDESWKQKAVTDLSASAALDLYRAEIERSNAVLASVGSPEDAPGCWPEEIFGEWRLENVREVLLHMITETACHAGHLDAVRELLDGRKWLVLD
jgi:Protein of unknown function (DUF664)